MGWIIKRSSELNANLTSGFNLVQDIKLPTHLGKWKFIHFMHADLLVLVLIPEGVEGHSADQVASQPELKRHVPIQNITVRIQVWPPQDLKRKLQS